MWFMAITQDRGVKVLLAAIVLAAIGWILPWTWPEPAAIAVFVVPLISTAAWAILQRIPNPAVARALDRRFGTKDALATALQFSPDDPFGEAIHARANAFAGGDVNEAFPLRWRPRRVTVLAVMMLVLLVLIVTTNPQDDRRAEIAAEEERLEQLAQDFTAEADALRESEDEAAEALAAALDEAAEALRTTGDTELAATGLEQAQTDILRTLDAESLAQRAAVVGLERALDDEPFPGLGPTEASPADQLSSIAESLTTLSDAQQGALANQLGRLADAQEIGDPATAEALRGAEEALINGDVIAAARALEEASEAAGVATEAAGEANAVAEAAANAAQSAQDIRDPDAASGEGGSDGAGGGDGQSDSSGGGGTGGGGAPDGAPPAAPGTGDDEPDEVPPVGEAEQVDVDSLVSGDGSGVTVNNERVTTPGITGAAAVLVDSLPSEFSQQAVESLDGSTNISGNEAATVASYFDLLTEETP